MRTAVKAEPLFAASRLPHVLHRHRGECFPSFRHRRASRRVFICRARIDAAVVLSERVHEVVNFLVYTAPGPLKATVLELGTDVADVVALEPKWQGLLRLGLLYYTFIARPSPFFGALDFYFLNTFSKLTQKQWRVDELTLRERLGGGNFGQVYEGLVSKNGDGRAAARAELTAAEKKRRVVLKRVNLDGTDARRDFLRAGTMAKGAAESGQAEAYMCSRIMRDPLVRPAMAEYAGTFVADASGGGFTRGTQWLVWKFESDSTLADCISGQLGPFPACVASIVLGRERSDLAEEARDAAVVATLVRRLLRALVRLHSLGVVHRDIKPDNVLLTNRGAVKVIDFGAAVDMCCGINFNPQSGMLDPRYSPPEELVMPRWFPRAPPPLLAAALAPITWGLGRPDLFDTYSAGILLIQLSVPQLRQPSAARSFNPDLARCDYDLDLWRAQRGRAMDFSLLDRAGGAGWDLARRLIRRRNALNRGRLDAAGALRHRYFGAAGAA